MMKKQIGQIVLIMGIALSVVGCGGSDSSDDATVAFRNDSASKTVCAIWDGVSTGALPPGALSASRVANAGTHTIKWTDCQSHDLTTMGWPNLVEGHSYTFPYQD
jgi:hypothetical protein